MEIYPKNSIAIGIGGHYGIIDGSSSQIIKQLKKAQQKIAGCPINFGAKTRMKEDTFRKTCVAFQKRAGLTAIAPTNISKSTDILGGYFKSKDKSLCSRCRTGASVRNMKRLCTLPTGIEMDETLGNNSLRRKL